MRRCETLNPVNPALGFAPRPVAPSVYSIVFVMGEPNTAPGASGWIHISQITLEQR